ncbi:MAG TPA: TMEM165/GDT1 family protein [Allosphingosinicella sp.]|nr:TMEM165/GDT1 family protein [Allosphingosinicella sp.]
MEALVTAFVAAFLGEWGDKTQLVVAMLAATTKKPGQVLIGLFLAALASSVAASLAGVYIAQTVTIRAMTLLTALALLFAAGSGLITRRDPAPATARVPILTAFILCLAAELGDRTQFTTFALAGRFNSAPLAAAGATAAILAACIPAAMLGASFRETIPLRPIRYAVAALFLIVGFIAAVKALQLA